MIKSNPIEKVKNLLGLIVFSTLIVEATIGIVITTIAEEHKISMIWAMIAFVVFMVLLYVGISIFRPEALRGERYTKKSEDEDKSNLQKIESLGVQLSNEQNKAKLLESELKELRTQLEPRQKESLKLQIINHCSTVHSISFQELCRKLGIKDYRSREGKLISEIIGSMKKDGEINDNYVLRS